MIIKQTIKDVNVYKDSIKIYIKSEVFYKYSDNNLKEKIERKIENNDTFEKSEYYVNNKIVKATIIHNLMYAYWKYDTMGKLIEHIKNPYEKEIYSYKNSLLKKTKVVIKRPRKKKYEIVKTIDYEYYPNDSIKSVITKENGNISKMKYYYEYH